MSSFNKAIEPVKSLRDNAGSKVNFYTKHNVYLCSNVGGIKVTKDAIRCIGIFIMNMIKNNVLIWIGEKIRWYRELFESWKKKAYYFFFRKKLVNSLAITKNWFM